MPPVLVMEVVREGLKSADARIKRLEIDEPFRIVAVTKAFQLSDVDPIYGTNPVQPAPTEANHPRTRTQGKREFRASSAARDRLPARLKIRVSVVRFRPWPPLESALTVTYRTRRGTRRYPTAGEVTLSH